MLHWRWPLPLQFSLASASVLGCFLGRLPRCRGCGKCTPSCGATMRSRPRTFATAKGYLPLIVVRMVVGTT